RAAPRSTATCTSPRTSATRCPTACSSCCGCSSPSATATPLSRDPLGTRADVRLRALHEDGVGDVDGVVAQGGVDGGQADVEGGGGDLAVAVRGRPLRLPGVADPHLAVVARRVHLAGADLHAAGPVVAALAGGDGAGVGLRVAVTAAAQRDDGGGGGSDG